MIDSSIAQGHPQTTFAVWDRQTTHESSQNSLAMQNMNSISTMPNFPCHAEQFPMSDINTGTALMNRKCLH